MSSSLLITLEMAGVLGVVIGFGLWELWTLRRDKALDNERDLSQLTQDVDTSVDGQPTDKQSSFLAK
jgi:hypothetical protein